VRRVHVDQDQPLGGLREDIDAVKLRDRLAERPALARRVDRGILGPVRVECGCRSRLAERQPARGPRRRPPRFHDDGCRPPGASARFGERPLDRAKEKIMDGAGIPETHFELLRVRIDVELQGVEREVQDPGRMALAMAHVPVAEADSAAEQPIAHHAAVDEQELAVGLRPRRRRQADPALEPESRVRKRDMARCREEVGSNQPRDARFALCPSRGGRQGEVLAPVVHERESDVEAGQCEPRHRLQDVLELGRLGAQELAARRHAVEQVAHLDGRAGRMRRGRDSARHAVDGLQGGAALRVPRPGSDAQRRYRGDRR
jgi:hypothetical protein